MKLNLPHCLNALNSEVSYHAVHSNDVLHLDWDGFPSDFILHWKKFQIECSEMLIKIPFVIEINNTRTLFRICWQTNKQNQMPQK